MKQNFLDIEISTVVSTLGSKLHISINRAGNIKVINNEEPSTRSYRGNISHGFWVLYHNESGYIWRRHNGNGYCYPLNMVGRKNDTSMSPFIYTDENGRTRKAYYRPYDIKNSHFSTFDEALNYFVKYLEKYKGIKL